MSSQAIALDPEEAVIRVTGETSPTRLATALVHAVLDDREVVMRAVGARAVNQAIKACVLARAKLEQRGIDLCLRPGFAPAPMADAQLTATTLHVVAR